MYPVTEIQITKPGPNGIPIAVPIIIKIQVHTTKESHDSILVLLIPKAAFTSSHLIAAHTKENTSA